MNPHEEAMHDLATEFNQQAQKLDDEAGDQTMHAATYANRGDVCHARECLDNATAFGHRAFAWSLAARRLEEAINRLHQAAVAGAVVKTAFVKVGTMPGECVEVRIRPEDEGKDGRCQFRRDPAEPWQDAIIDRVEDGRLFLRLA